jgi:Protein of unknown function (DUF3553)
MQAGDLVTYHAHPEWGSGLVHHVTATGLLAITFEIPGHGMYEDHFHPLEVELTTRARATA